MQVSDEIKEEAKRGKVKGYFFWKKKYILEITIA